MHVHDRLGAVADLSSSLGSTCSKSVRELVSRNFFAAREKAKPHSISTTDTRRFRVVHYPIAHSPEREDGSRDALFDSSAKSLNAQTGSESVNADETLVG